MDPNVECDFTKYMFLDQHPNQPIRIEGYLQEMPVLGLQQGLCWVHTEIL